MEGGAELPLSPNFGPFNSSAVPSVLKHDRGLKMAVHRAGRDAEDAGRFAFVAIALLHGRLD